MNHYARTNPSGYRLFTTLTDPEDVSASDLAAAYTQGSAIEMAFDELKTHQPRTAQSDFAASPSQTLMEPLGCVLTG